VVEVVRRAPCGDRRGDGGRRRTRNQRGRRRHPDTVPEDWADDSKNGGADDSNKNDSGNNDSGNDDEGEA
jgi:hypothetical protein